MVWFVLYGLLLSGLQENRAQTALYAKLRVQLASETAPVGGAIQNRAPVALLDIPKAGLRHAVVVEGTSSADLQNGPGHLVNTVLPGQAGVSAILGKGVTFGAPFADVTKLEAGDPVTVTTGQGVAKYVVNDVRSSGDPLPAALSSGQGRLTLVAVVGSGWRAGWAPTQTVYVDASLQGAGFVAPPGQPTQTPDEQSPMDGSPGALYPLVLWLQLLLAASIGVAWARGRWGGWQVWLTAAPLVLAIVWMATETATRLLPNLL